MDPTPADPANEDAAKIFMADKVRYSYLVRECARKSIDKGTPSTFGLLANIWIAAKEDPTYLSLEDLRDLQETTHCNALNLLTR